MLLGMLGRKTQLLNVDDDQPAVLHIYEDRKGSPTPKRKRESLLERDQEERRLGNLIFGEKYAIPDYQSDNGGSSGGESEEEMEEDFRQRGTAVLEATPIWQDDDDKLIRIDISDKKGLRKLRKREEETEITGLEYTDRLRAQYQKLSQQPLWSLPDIGKKHGDSDTDSSEGEDDGEALLRTTASLLTGSVARLPGGVVDIKKLRDANISRRADAVIQSVEFHPSANVMLTAGMHKTLSLFQVDGDTNPHLQSVFIKRFPIHTAHFASGGEEVVMAANKHWYYTYDIPSGKVTRINEIKGHSKEKFSNFIVSPDDRFIAFSGKDGYIILVSNKTKQWVGEFKMNGSVTGVAFTPDSLRLFSTGSDGHVYVWDLRSHDCIHRFVDEGCVQGTALGISPNGQFVAAGSSSGVVNVYDQSCMTQAKPRPLKAVMNLTTSASEVQFNHTSELLAISSKEKKSAVKLVHLSSMSVYSNWPISTSPLSYVSSLDFSSDSHYVAVGNDKGRVPLYRLNHFHKRQKK